MKLGSLLPVAGIGVLAFLLFRYRGGTGSSLVNNPGLPDPGEIPFPNDPETPVGYFTTPTDLPGRPGWHYWFDVRPGGGSELFVQEPGGLMFEGRPAECIYRGGDWDPYHFASGCTI